MFYLLLKVVGYLYIFLIKKSYVGASLVVQWLRLRAPNAGGLGLIPDQRTRSHMQQLKIPCAAIKTQSSQINKNKYFFKILLFFYFGLCWVFVAARAFF